MAQNKIQAIQDWPKPCKVRDVPSFIGFTNFFHHFIHNYSVITVPLTCLTKQNVLWDFSMECQMVFETLKKAFTLVLVLTHWIPDTPIMVETDASDYVLAAVLSITTPSGKLHPVAFHSCTFHEPEHN